MRKLQMLQFCLFLFFLSPAFAQTQEITGRVTDAKGNPVPGASIRIKATKKGISADANGIFKINVAVNTKLVITGVGFDPQEIVVNGGETNPINIMLKQTNTSLSEVVVTALGIKREKKSLGYSAQEVKGDVLTEAGTSNAISALSGKIAGLQVTNSSGTPGAAAYIRLRGITSLGGGEPLMVIDGVPMDNSTTGMSLGNVAQSNRAIDLNPDDIENVTVLKGPAAASLYGTAGSDGVILITTKRGKSKFELDYSYGITLDQVNRLPELQDMYAQGTSGQYRSPLNHTSTSFGPLIDTLKWTGVSNKWDPHGDIVGASNPSGTIPVKPYDNARQFFRTGTTQTHSVAVTGGTATTSYRLSYSNLNQDGIIPLSSFQRNTVSFNADTKLTDELKMGSSVSYLTSGGSRVQEGSNLSGVFLGLLRTPVTFDNSYGSSNASNMASYQLADGTERTYRGAGVYGAPYGYYDNPYWTVNKNKFNDNVNRILGNVYLTYNPLKWLSVTERLGLDQYTDSRKQNFALNSAAGQPGQVIYDIYYYKHLNNDLLVTLSKKLASRLNGSLLLGNNLYTESTQHNNQTGTGLTIPDFYDLGNTSTQSAFTNSSLLRKKAFFAQAKLDFNNDLFLDLTARDENSSAFVSNNHLKGQWFFFPSANVSFIFSDALGLKSQLFNYGKLRLSYGQAGRLPAVYATSTYYSSLTIADGFTTGLVYPINGQQGYFGGTLASPTLKPERTSTIDAGADLKFLNNRVGVSFTYYNAHSKDLLVSQPIPPSSGYLNIYTNAAEIQNHGIELELNLEPLKSNFLSWDIELNWSMNRSKVISLGPGIDQLTLGGFTNGSINALKGQPYGVIYGVGYYKDAQGRTVISDGQDPNTAAGYPILNSNAVALGNPNPQWIGGIRNAFTFRNFTFSFLFDTKQKFDIWNGTRGALVNFGMAKETEARGTSIVFSGVSGHTDVNGNVISSGSPNKTSALLSQSWYQGGGSGFNVTQPFVEDGSFVKLREVVLGYTLDLAKKLAGRKMFIKAVTFSLVGRNLLLFTKYKGIDPETSLAGGAALGIDYFNNPSTRSFGLNIKVRL